MIFFIQKMHENVKLKNIVQNYLELLKKLINELVIFMKVNYLLMNSVTKDDIIDWDKNELNDISDEAHN